MISLVRQSVISAYLSFSKYKLIVSIFICLFIVGNTTVGQELHHVTRSNAANGELLSLFGENYFIASRNGDEPLILGDSTLYGKRNDILTVASRRDIFFVKLHSDHAISAWKVIDNCENYDDHTSVGDLGVLLINFATTEDADSLAIMTMPDGTEIPRKDHLGQSVLVVTDKEMHYIKHVTPTSGLIKEIEGGEDALYMSIIIPEGDTFIIVGHDTVFNVFEPGWIPLPTVVIAKYDLESEEVVWWKRLGTPWRDILWDFKLDGEEDILVLIEPTGFDFHIGDADSIEIGTGPYYNVLLKFDSDGNYVWGENFDGAGNEFLSGLYIDSKNNVYISGQVGGGPFTFFDTTIQVVYSSVPEGQGVLLKFAPDAEFQWVSHIEGIYNHASYSDLVFVDSTSMYISGISRNGFLYLNDIMYEAFYPEEGSFIIKLDLQTGEDLDHLWLKHDHVARFLNLELDENGDLLAYFRLRGEVNFLGEQLESLEASTSGFLLTISSEWDSIVSTHALTPDLFKLYPNPIAFNSNIQIEIDDRFDKDEVSMIITDSYGRVVKVQEQIRSRYFSVDLQGLLPAIYNIMIYDSHSYQVEKLIIH